MSIQGVFLTYRRFLVVVVFATALFVGGAREIKRVKNQYVMNPKVG